MIYCILLFDQLALLNPKTSRVGGFLTVTISSNVISLRFTFTPSDVTIWPCVTSLIAKGQLILPARISALFYLSFIWQFFFEQNRKSFQSEPLQIMEELALSWVLEAKLPLILIFLNLAESKNHHQTTLKRRWFRDFCEFGSEAFVDFLSPFQRRQFSSYVAMRL